MFAQLCISSSRVWIGIFVLYMCAMLYGLVAMVGDPKVSRKSAMSDQGSPDVHGNNIGIFYDDDLLKSSAFKDDVADSPTNLQHLPIDFPLAHGLAKPIPVIRVGNARTNATVAMGIPSVKRQGQDYLVSTMESLVRHLTEEQKKNTIFIIYLGEVDTDYLDKRTRDLQSRFEDEIANGMIEIIAPPRTLYPDWSKTVRSSFGDTIERSKWRSKQNLDQVFLMMYIYHLRARYYLMMEDDVVATSEYMTKLLKTLTTKDEEPWTYLSFCGLGAIGKLFRRRTLPSYASFLHTFWNAKPLDWLQVDFARARICSYDETDKLCFKRLKTITPEIHPSLFQHVGRFSSLPGKIQKLRDKKFRN